eukprot:gene18855-biopygen2460
MVRRGRRKAAKLLHARTPPQWRKDISESTWRPEVCARGPRGRARAGELARAPTKTHLSGTTVPPVQSSNTYCTT